MRVFNRELSEGFEGVKQTVRTIAALAFIGSSRPQIQRLIREVDRTDTASTVRDLDTIARRSIRYQLDPLGIEQVSGIDALLSRRRGDCDDFSVLLGALGLALDIPTRLTVVRRKGRRTYHHIFPEFYLDGRWIPIDSTSENPPGVYPERIASSVNFPILKRRAA